MDDHILIDAERIERLEALLEEHLIKCPGTRDQPVTEAEAI